MRVRKEKMLKRPLQPGSPIYEFLPAKDYSQTAQYIGTDCDDITSGSWSLIVDKVTLGSHCWSLSDLQFVRFPLQSIYSCLGDWYRACSRLRLTSVPIWHVKKVSLAESMSPHEGHRFVSLILTRWRYALKHIHVQTGFAIGSSLCRHALCDIRVPWFNRRLHRPRVFIILRGSVF